MANIIKDLSGQRFGKLVALKPVVERKNGYVMWECICDCGNTAIVSSKHLATGSTSSCGCLGKERAMERTVDISGQRFGKLVALKPTEERRGRIVVWECKCDCGNTAYVLKSTLMRGSTRSCGCLHRENANRNPVRDLTGKRFGKLVVVGPTAQRKGTNVVWKCICDCGNTTFASTNALTNGNKRSCGCLSKKYLAENLIRDLTGQRFGRLVALKPTEERKNGYVVWECKCDCGNNAYVPTSLLTSGNTSSCGCLKKQGVGRKRPKDLIGQQFEKLVAPEPAAEQKNEGQCNCGNMFDAQSLHIMNEEYIASYVEEEEKNGASKDCLRQRKNFAKA